MLKTISMTMIAPTFSPTVACIFTNFSNIYKTRHLKVATFTIESMFKSTPFEILFKDNLSLS